MVAADTVLMIFRWLFPFYTIITKETIRQIIFESQPPSPGMRQLAVAPQLNTHHPKATRWFVLPPAAPLQPETECMSEDPLCYSPAPLRFTGICMCFSHSKRDYVE